MREMCGEHIVVAQGPALAKFNKIISLNPSAALLWEKVEGGKEFTVESLADAIQENYEGVDRERALTDAAKLASDWIKAGIASE